MMISWAANVETAMQSSLRWMRCVDGSVSPHMTVVTRYELQYEEPWTAGELCITGEV